MNNKTRIYKLILILLLTSALLSGCFSEDLCTLTAGSAASPYQSEDINGFTAAGRDSQETSALSLETEDTASADEDTEKPQSAADTSSDRPANAAEAEMSQTEPSGEYVWIAKNGSRYHRDPSCSNMKSPQRVELSYARSKGLTPCKKC